MSQRKLKIDLHVHSASSYDCCTTVKQFKKAFDQGKADKVAITDHSTIGLAYELKKVFGDRIIIGEEIKSQFGEIIGLFLEKEIPWKLTPEETITEIRKQNGIVYIPHPFDFKRYGISRYKDYEKIMKEADIIEVFNSRCFTYKPNKIALEYANKFNKLKASASDAHNWRDLGRSYMLVDPFKTKNELLEVLKDAELFEHKASLISFTYPSYNKVKKSLDKQRL